MKKLIYELACYEYELTKVNQSENEISRLTNAISICRSALIKLGLTDKQIDEEVDKEYWSILNH